MADKNPIFPKEELAGRLGIAPDCTWMHGCEHGWNLAHDSKPEPSAESVEADWRREACQNTTDALSGKFVAAESVEEDFTQWNKRMKTDFASPPTAKPAAESVEADALNFRAGRINGYAFIELFEGNRAIAAVRERHNIPKEEWADAYEVMRLESERRNKRLAGTKIADSENYKAAEAWQEKALDFQERIAELEQKIADLLSCDKSN